MRLVIDRAPDVELEVHRVVSDGRVAEFLDDRLPVALDLSRLLLRSEGRDYVRLETDDRLDEGVVRGAPLRPPRPCVSLHPRRRAVDHAENALPLVRRGVDHRDGEAGFLRGEQRFDVIDRIFAIEDRRVEVERAPLGVLPR